MYPNTPDAPFASAEQHPDGRLVSPEPIEGYVLDPWSGLYQETEATRQNRLQTPQAAAA